ncbi:hypothetical protein ACH4E5_41220 [Streptomyces afghaniensis]|uniref:hypothetical protein n=1 Tax=Streptomyces afghaniensis TaxID=66865 RepID=UPI0037AA57FA
MAALTSAVVLVGILCAVDLLLTIGVIKKLREYGPAGPAGAPGRGMAPLRPGEELPAFTAVAVDGAPVSRSWLPGGALLAFLSPNCEPCRAKLPELVAYAAAEPGGRDRTLAVVVGEPWTRTPGRCRPCAGASSCATRGSCTRSGTHGSSRASI